MLYLRPTVDHSYFFEFIIFIQQNHISTLDA